MLIALNLKLKQTIKMHGYNICIKAHVFHHLGKTDCLIIYLRFPRVNENLAWLRYNLCSVKCWTKRISKAKEENTLCKSLKL